MKDSLKLALDKGMTEYIETKLDGHGGIDLSIRTASSDKKVVVLTAKLDSDHLSKLITNLVSLKARLIDEERK